MTPLLGIQGNQTTDNHYLGYYMNTCTICLLTENVIFGEGFIST